MSKLPRPIPAWRERQIAARAEAQEDRSHVRLSLLLDLQGDAPQDDDEPVGYAHRSLLDADEVICWQCVTEPLVPPAWVPVFKHFLAARRRCSRCERVLETLAS